MTNDNLDMELHTHHKSCLACKIWFGNNTKVFYNGTLELFPLQISHLTVHDYTFLQLKSHILKLHISPIQISHFKIAHFSSSNLTFPPFKTSHLCTCKQTSFWATEKLPSPKLPWWNLQLGFHHFQINLYTTLKQHNQHKCYCKLCTCSVEDAHYTSARILRQVMWDLNWRINLNVKCEIWLEGIWNSEERNIKFQFAKFEVGLAPMGYHNISYITF